MPEAHGVYAEHDPPAALLPFVECFWTKTGPPGDVQDVLPDGCVDLLFDLSGSDPRSSIVGAMTRPLRVRSEAQVDVLGVRFRPGGAYPFLRAPLLEWTDRTVPLEPFWTDARRWTEELAEAGGPAPRLERLGTELLAALPRLHPVDARLRAGIGALWRRPATPVGELAEELGLSRQHLTRKLKEVTGLGPKRLARVARLRRLQRLVAGSATRDWADLAVAAGYYDQSHLIAEFRELAGNTPGRHFR